MLRQRSIIARYCYSTKTHESSLAAAKEIIKNQADRVLAAVKATLDEEEYHRTSRFKNPKKKEKAMRHIYKCLTVSKKIVSTCKWIFRRIPRWKSPIDFDFPQRLLLGFVACIVFLSATTFGAVFVTNKIRYAALLARAQVFAELERINEYLPTVSNFVQNPYRLPSSSETGIDQLSVRFLFFDFAVRALDKGQDWWNRFCLDFARSVGIAQGYCLLLAQQQYRATSLQFRQRREQFDWKRVDVTSAVVFPGAQMNSFALIWVFMFLVIFFVAFCALWKPLREKLLDQLAGPILMLLGVFVGVHILTKILGRRIVSRHSVSIYTRPAFALYETLGVFLHSVAAASLVFIRMVVSLAIYLLRVARLDSPTWKGSDFADTGHGSFKAMVFLDCLHNSPLCSCLREHLIEQLDARWMCEHRPTGNVEPSKLRRDKKEVLKERAVRKMVAHWHLLAVLRSNEAMGIGLYRKHKLFPSMVPFEEGKIVEKAEQKIAMTDNDNIDTAQVTSPSVRSSPSIYSPSNGYKSVSPVRGSRTRRFRSVV